MVSTQPNTTSNTTEVSQDSQTTQSSAATQPSVAGEVLQNTTVTAESPAENTTVTAESPAEITTVASSESSVENATVTTAAAVENGTTTPGSNVTGNGSVTTPVDEETNNVTTSVLANEETSTEAGVGGGGFFLVSVGGDGTEQTVYTVVNTDLSLPQPTTGVDQLLDVAESDNSGERKQSDNTVTDLNNTHDNTPTYNHDLNHTSHTDQPGRIAMSKTSAEEIFSQNYEDDVTSSVLELLSSTESETIVVTSSTNTTRDINSSEFEELDVRGISGTENNNLERQDYAQSRSLKLGEGENAKEKEEEEVS